MGASSASPVALATIDRAISLVSRGRFLERSSMTREKYTAKDHAAARQAVEDLFREVASRFAHARVRTDLPGPGGRPGILELSCSLPGTARVRALAGADQVDLYLGEAKWLEIFPSRRNPDKMLASVRKAVETVVAGNFKERLHGHAVRYRPYG